MTTREAVVEAGVRAQARPAAEIQGVMVRGRKARTPLGDALRTLLRKPWAMIGLIVVAAWLLVGLLAPVLMFRISRKSYKALARDTLSALMTSGETW
jgi:hypothetical protein